MSDKKQFRMSILFAFSELLLVIGIILLLVAAQQNFLSNEPFTSSQEIMSWVGMGLLIVGIIIFVLTRKHAQWLFDITKAIKKNRCS